MLQVIIKSFEIRKKGRKLFECNIGKYPCKLVINEVSKDFNVGDVVLLHVHDDSTRSYHGTSLRFNPVGVVEPGKENEYTNKYRGLKYAEAWLYHAEKDVERGIATSNAIRKALYYCAGEGSLNLRRSMLKENIKSIWAEESARIVKERERLREQARQEREATVDRRVRKIM
jgi:hypothetical protein